MKLSEAPIGSKVVVKLLDEAEITPKLRAIGILPGVSIYVVKSAPMGDPRMYKVFNKIISLRQSEASLIEVDLLQESTIPLSYAIPGEYIVKGINGGFGIRKWLEKIGITEGTKITLLTDRRVQTVSGIHDIGFGKLSKISVVSSAAEKVGDDK
ncbi:FeoA domain-containing protein [Fervidobacterium sp.]